MTTASVAPTMSPSQPRTVIGGRIDGDLYVIVLDGPQEVETPDEHVAQAAASSKRQGKGIEVELDPATNGGRPRIREIRIVPLASGPGETPAQTTAVSTRSAGTLASAPPMPTGLISRPEELTQQLAAMAQHYHVLSPAIAVSEFAPGFGANLAIVRIDPTITEWDERNNGAGPDTYCSGTIHKSRDKRSLNKSGLQKIAQALGIQWDHQACRRMDDGRERNLWIWKYVGYVRTHDGQLQTVEGSRELDLRDGSAEAAEARGGQLQKMRANGNQICETKAMQRAIRTFVRQSYTVAELQKPFLITRFSFTPDMNDPEIKKLVTQNAMAGIGALYQTPPAQALPALPAADDIDDAITSDAPTPKADKALGNGPEKSNPFAEPSSTEHPTVLKVEHRSGKNPKSGKSWTLYKVTFSTGEVATTFSESLHKLIDEAEAKKLPVRYQTEPADGDYDDKLAAFSIIDTRQGTLPMSSEEGGKY